MGSTAQSTNLTPSTFVGGITQGAALYMQAVTSSGAYFQVGDAQDVIIFVANGSSTVNGAVWIEPGGSAWAGAPGLPASTTSTLYSTATAPIAVSVVSNAVTGSSNACASTAGSFVAIGPLEAATVKSTSGKIFMVASTGSLLISAAVYAFGLTSTN
jgi:hypothetical protein